MYRAWDTASGTVVALKVLHTHPASDLGALERFRREAQLAAVVAIAISAGGNDLVSDLITDAGMVAEAPRTDSDYSAHLGRTGLGLWRARGQHTIPGYGFNVAVGCDTPHTGSDGRHCRSDFHDSRRPYPCA